MWKRLCGRDYVEEIMWKRLYGREEVFNMTLVSVKITENRAAPVPSTTRARQNQSSIINHQSSIINHQYSEARCTRIWISDVNESNISADEAISNDRYAYQQMIECYLME
jgi:hypothetical protein